MPNKLPKRQEYVDEENTDADNSTNHGTFCNIYKLNKSRRNEDVEGTVP